MRNLKEILTKDLIEQFMEAAEKLGFSKIKLYNSPAQGHLGIYAFFKSNIDSSEYYIRSLALSYKLGVLTLCKTGVITNDDDVEGTIEKEKTLDFYQINTTDFNKIYGCNAGAVEIEEDNKFSLESYKVYYDHIITNKKSTETTDISSVKMQSATKLKF